jgi:hypothetical protein
VDKDCYCRCFSSFRSLETNHSTYGCRCFPQQGKCCLRLTQQPDHEALHCSFLAQTSCWLGSNSNCQSNVQAEVTLYPQRLTMQPCLQVLEAVTCRHELADCATCDRWLAATPFNSMNTQDFLCPYLCPFAAACLDPVPAGVIKLAVPCSRAKLCFRVYAC